MSYEVDVCTQAAIDRLLASDITALDRQQHLERWEMQQRGEAVYLLAWSDGEMVGRGTVLRESKYDNVRLALGSFPEVNALEARIQNIGIGTELMRLAETVALAGGHRTVGVAVELANPGALRLYERLRYERWTEGVVDRWTERNGEGLAIVEHADDCLYLRKKLVANRTLVPVFPEPGSPTVPYDLNPFSRVGGCEDRRGVTDTVFIDPVGTRVARR